MLRILFLFSFLEAMHLSLERCRIPPNMHDPFVRSRQPKSKSTDRCSAAGLLEKRSHQLIEFGESASSYSARKDSYNVFYSSAKPAYSSQMTLTAGSFELFGLLISLGFRFDALSISLLLMVVILGAVIAKYSIRYLAGEKRQSYFYFYFAVTLFAVCLLLLSSNFVMLLFAWLLTSAGLHKLLTFYPERPAALRAARKKFFVSRIGDIAILTAIFLTYHYFGTLEFSELFSYINSTSKEALDSSALTLISIFFVIGAITKSAQLPFHFWLPETMEAPTPISALMHAGIINAGGFLMIRISPLLQYSFGAHFILVSFGAITAVFGALVMMTQNDIKKKLAYSTISQMGIMMLCCGLEAYSLALFHIIAHSFYKAHAFLSTGELVEESKKAKPSPPHPSGLRLTIFSSAGLLFILAGSYFFSGSYVSYFTYAAILLLGLSQSLHFSSKAFSLDNFKFLFQIGLIFIGTAGACAFIESFLKTQLELGVTATSENINLRIASCIIAYGIFVVGLWLSTVLIEQKSKASKTFYLFIWNAGYFYQLTNRLMRSFSGAK